MTLALNDLRTLCIPIYFCIPINWCISSSLCCTLQTNNIYILSRCCNFFLSKLWFEISRIFFNVWQVKVVPYKPRNIDHLIFLQYLVIQTFRRQEKGKKKKKKSRSTKAECINKSFKNTCEAWNTPLAYARNFFMIAAIGGGVTWLINWFTQKAHFQAPDIVPIKQSSLVQGSYSFIGPACGKLDGPYGMAIICNLILAS